MKTLIAAITAASFALIAAPVSAKTETQIKNERRAKEYKERKAQENATRRAEQAQRKAKK